MTISTADPEALKQMVRQLAQEGRTISSISEELEISWSEAASYTLSWRGAKVRVTNRLNRLAKENDQSKREQLSAEADLYVDFLYDAAKHLRSQVNRARRALDR